MALFAISTKAPTRGNTKRRIGVNIEADSWDAAKEKAGKDWRVDGKLYRSVTPH